MPQMWREAVASRDKLLAHPERTHDCQPDAAIHSCRAVFPSNPEYQDLRQHGPGAGCRRRLSSTSLPARRRPGIGLAIADVSDKGVPAALFMMSSRTLLKGSAIGNFADPGRRAHGSQQSARRDDNDAAMFVTMFYAIYDPAAGTLVTMPTAATTSRC